MYNKVCGTKKIFHLDNRNFFIFLLKTKTQLECLTIPDINHFITGLVDAVVCSIKRFMQIPRTCCIIMMHLELRVQKSLKYGGSVLLLKLKLKEPVKRSFLFKIPNFLKSVKDVEL